MHHTWVQATRARDPLLSSVPPPLFCLLCFPVRKSRLHIKTAEQLHFLCSLGTTCFKSRYRKNGLSEAKHGFWVEWSSRVSFCSLNFLDTKLRTSDDCPTTGLPVRYLPVVLACIPYKVQAVVGVWLPSVSHQVAAESAEDRKLGAEPVSHLFITQSGWMAPLRVAGLGVL